MTDSAASAGYGSDADTARYTLAAARSAEVDDGLVRMTAELAHSLGLRPLDAVRVRSERGSVVARVEVAARGELAAGELRLGGLARQACRAIVGQGVTLEPVSPQACRVLHLAPVGIAGDAVDVDAAVQRQLQGRVLQAGMMFRLHWHGRVLPLAVERTEPDGVVSISADTAVALGEAATDPVAEPVLYEDLGGLDREVARLREIAELPLLHPGLLERLGVPLARGLVVSGPRGVGRRSLVRALAFETGASLHRIDMSAAAGLPPEDAVAVLERAVRAAQAQTPALLLLEDAGHLDGMHEGRLVTALAEAMDALPAGAGVLAVATVERSEDFHPQLRRPGRFDREIVLTAPDTPGRRQILEILTRGMPLAGDVDLMRVASASHGYVGADLAAVTREAMFAALRRLLPEMDVAAADAERAVGRIAVAQQDFETALNEVPPSASFAFFSDVPAAGFEAVGGLAMAKELLTELVVWPLRHAELYDRLRVVPQTGLLLCGPSGCGKTMLVAALARETGVALLSVSGPQLAHGWFGDPDSALTELFQRARQAAPAIVLLDELDVLLDHHEGLRGDRDKQRLLVRLMHELDNVAASRHVWVLATCREATDVPNRLFAPGRLDRRLDVEMPEKEERLEILRVHTRHMQLGADLSLDGVAEATGQFSGADLAALCRAAAQAAVRGHLAEQLRPAAPSEAASGAESRVVPLQQAGRVLVQRSETGAWVRRRIEAAAMPQPRAETPAAAIATHAPDGTPLVMLRHFERAMDQMRGNG